MLANMIHMLFHICAKIFTMVTKQKMDDQMGDNKISFKFFKWYFPWISYLTSINMIAVNITYILKYGSLFSLRFIWTAVDFSKTLKLFFKNFHTTFFLWFRELTNFIDILIGWSWIIDLCIGGISPCWWLHLHIATLWVFGDKYRWVFNSGIWVFRTA